MINKPGIYQISHADYHADPCETPSLSRSIIKDLLYSVPAHVYHSHPRLNPQFVEKAADPKFDIGTAAHAMLLEGMEGIEIIEAKDYKSGKAQDARDEARRGGKTPLLPHQFVKVCEMVDAAKRQIADCPELKIKDLKEEGKAEQSYIWQDGNIWLRSRPDWISKDSKLILDYKTTDDTADPNAFARKADSLGYDIQDALYSEGVEKLADTKPKFIFVVQETYAPYLCSFVALPPRFKTMGEQKIVYGKRLWQECLSNCYWPAYPNQVCYVDPSPYALAAWEARAAEISII